MTADASMRLSAALEHEHHLIDDALAVLASDDAVDPTDAQRMAAMQAIALLRRHIYLEEEFLFPPLRDAGLMAPVMVMVREHGQMWPVLDLIEQRLSTGSGAESLRSTCRDLLAQLAAHNVKEERILYPQADELLPAADVADLTRLMTTDHTPDGWVCQGAASS